MVEGLVAVPCQNQVLVLTRLVAASCLCVKKLVIEMHYGVVDVCVLKRRGAMEIFFFGYWCIWPP